MIGSWHTVPLLKQISGKFLWVFLFALPAAHIHAENVDCLFRDLELVHQINCEIHDELPFVYNAAFVGGYFNTPSARMPKSGDLALGASYVPPYTVYGANFAPFSRIELAANYRVYNGVLEGNFGKEGFGDDADRVGNVKFGLLAAEDQVPYFPLLAFGLDDVVGTKRFSSQYVVATKCWKEANLEMTLGYGWGRMKGVFGGAMWTPFRQTCAPILKDLTLMVEYDPINYKKHKYEHEKGRSVSSRFNGGITYLFRDTLQLTVHSVRGEKVGGSASIRFPLGSTEGIVPKVDDPCLYVSPIDTHPIGPERPEKEFAFDLACSFADQGLDLIDAYLVCNSCCDRQLNLKVVNNRYRRADCVRTRIQDLLAALAPSNLDIIDVTIESEGVESHRYCFRRCDLERLQECCLSPWELEVLSPMTDAGCRYDPYEIDFLFQKNREIWTLTVRPRVISFFGSTSGKFKYSLGVVGSFEGFIPGGFIYRAQTSYSAYSSMHGLLNRDRNNPSELLHVRTDAVKYYQGGRVRLEELFLQRSWNVGCGCFFRAAGGYFEPAYGGGAGEFLYYPAGSNWAIGADAAIVWKRQYNGLGFTSKVTRFNSNREELKEHFTGTQAFVNLIYNFEPLDLLFRIKGGQFLAKDWGARFEVTRYFKSGARFSLWVTATNGNDKVNGRTYFDKGFAFDIPFDIFLKKSSRTFLNYSMSAWLRDVGAIADTGKPLFPILYEERYD